MAMGQSLCGERGRSPGGVDPGPQPMLRDPRQCAEGRRVQHAGTAVRPTGPPPRRPGFLKIPGCPTELALF
jgi:hypothetical protein